MSDSTDLKRAGFPQICLAGIVGGVIGHGLLGALFYSPPLQALLYSNPSQAEIFLEVASPKNIPLCATGIVLLSILHAWFFSIFAPSIPGTTWVRKGLFWGFTIWAMYWLFQEWLIYTMLLGAPMLLNLTELALLLVGALAEGVAIAFLLARKRPAPVS